MAAQGPGARAWELIGATSTAIVMLSSVAAVEGLARNLETDNALESPAITVRVYDYVGMADAIAQAQLVASRIFEQTGVKLVWYNCWPRVSVNQSDTVCTRKPGPTDVVLRIVKQFETFPGLHSDTVGYTVGACCTVSFAQVMDCALMESAQPFLLLGRVMAHEIGHVFFRTAGHSAEGIMRARWGRRQLAVAATNDMFFTRKEAETLRAEVLARAREQQAAQARIAATQE